MAVTIRQAESAPASYPPAPSGLSTAAAALDPAMVWQRVESYIAHRYSERDVEWVVEGPGEWVPPLAPAAITTVEIWSCGANTWEECEPNASPLGGYWLPATGPYRFSGQVGAGDVPASVDAAWSRLAEYLAAKPGTAGATLELTRAGSVESRKQRDASWMASAMQNSGAADLLRSFRRV
ncbi:hypothetical protein [Bradyrhizobium pachyrhizi]|uniref:hypothetical protein n=1 Tax=Bradyrhizobium pachyrhizi TaxID=280333 RepID=UPI003D360DA5